MNNSQRGSIQLWVLAMTAVFGLVLAGWMLRYRRDLKAYRPSPIVPGIPSQPRKFIPRTIPQAMGFIPAYSISGALRDRPVLYKVFPVYPTWAEEAGVYGRVRLAFRVNDAGEVYPNVWVTQTVGRPELDELAIDALKHWKFAPLSSPSRRPTESIDLVSQATPGQAGVINFTFTLTNQPIRL